MTQLIIGLRNPDVRSRRAEPIEESSFHAEIKEVSITAQYCNLNEIKALTKLINVDKASWLPSRRLRLRSNVGIIFKRFLNCARMA